MTVCRNRESDVPGVVVAKTFDVDGVRHGHRLLVILLRNLVPESSPTNQRRQDESTNRKRLEEISENLPRQPGFDQKQYAVSPFLRPSSFTHVNGYGQFHFADREVPNRVFLART